MDISINEPEEAKNEYVMQEEDHYKNVGMTNAKMGRMESEKFGLYQDSPENQNGYKTPQNAMPIFLNDKPLEHHNSNQLQIQNSNLFLKQASNNQLI